MKHPDYERTTVEALITALFNMDTIYQEEYIEQGMPRSKNNPAHLGNSVAMMIDIRRAWMAVPMSDDERWATKMRYANGSTDRVIGACLQVSHTTANEMYTRTVSRLTNWLNGELNGEDNGSND